MMKVLKTWLRNVRTIIIAHIVRKCVSSNKKCIEDHNNSKPHQIFVKLQENTHIFKHFYIGN